VEAAQTWHYGLVAEWWANFNTDGPEIEYFARHVEAGYTGREPTAGDDFLVFIASE
jgi:hypothetical protein